MRLNKGVSRHVHSTNLPSLLHSGAKKRKKKNYILHQVSNPHKHTMSTQSTAADEKKSQILQQEYNRYQELIQELETQSSTLASQLQEHFIVDHSLTAIAPEKRQGRKCFKMIGGVLVEKSIDEVIKILADEVKELSKQKETVDGELKQNRATLDKWISSNKIKVVKG